MGKILRKIGFCLTLLLSAFVLSCSDDEPKYEPTRSIKDGIYAGNHLEVFIDGNLNKNVKSISVISDLKESDTREEFIDGIKYTYVDCLYEAKLEIDGFPGTKKQIEIVIQHNLVDFSGSADIAGTTYKYAGSFSNGPLLGVEFTTLTINFEKI